MSGVFKGCKSIDEKLEVLSELYLDAKQWRRDEGTYLKKLENRLKILEGEHDGQSGSAEISNRN